MTTHEVLVAARNLIDREGWLQRDAGDPGVGFCAMGACGFAEYSDPCRENLDCYLALRDALDDAPGFSGVRGWNDAPGRTKAEVLAAFDRAIAETAPPPADPFPAGPVGRASFREPVRS